jgi:uncharacterized membrane protein YbhN (UPF0104 family)
LKKKLSVIVLLVIGVALGVYIYRHAAEFSVIKQINHLFLLPLLVLSGLILVINGLLTKFFVGLFGTELSVKEWFGLSAVTAMGNYLAPFRGGLAGKALYLKKKHQFPYTIFLATYTASYVLILLLGSLLGLLAIVLFYLTYHVVEWRLVYFFIIVFVVVLGVLRLSSYMPRGTGRLSKRWREMNLGWQYIRKDKMLLIKVSLLIISNYMVISLLLYYGYMAISHVIPFLAALFIAIIFSYSIFISLTPGNLGIQESIIALLSKLFGLGFNEGLLVAGLLRVVLLIVVFSLGPIFSYLLARTLGSKTEANKS